MRRNLVAAFSPGQHVMTKREGHQMMLLLMILLVVLPYGTALACGAITYRAGDTMSGWSSIGGLALGIYFFSKSMDLLMPG